MSDFGKTSSARLSCYGWTEECKQAPNTCEKCVWFEQCKAKAKRFNCAHHNIYFDAVAGNYYCTDCKYEVHIEDTEGDTLWDLDAGALPVIEANDPWHAFKAAILYTKEKNVMPRQISVEPVDSDTSVSSLLSVQGAEK